ncbi:hypothetical protein [Pseudoclavibacter sp. 13-3]|uniref:hypothetical protein n=1 Tax=Pseudoclavibacter sp. 13-3 TaxID=2901228 RepID=UPI001E5C7D1A|nr:hypothetical protein [Pseudoclavibacter sp. 13-3]MCD7101736.1 hypothetical protein [Pseudoclavibacter sp. 13-3]
MIRDTLPSLAAGRRVLSTVRLLDDQGNDHPSYERFEDWPQLLQAEHCDVLMDEVTGIASSREASALPTEVANFLVQLRRRDVQLRWTAPNWARADKIIREVTQAVTDCRGLFGVRQTGGNVGLWSQKRLFWFRTYDAAQFEEFTLSSRQSVKPLQHELFWGPGSPAFAAYDTMDAVSIVGQQVTKGICLECGGVRRPKVCKCEH